MNFEKFNVVPPRSGLKNKAPESNRFHMWFGENGGQDRFVSI